MCPIFSTSLGLSNVPTNNFQEVLQKQPGEPLIILKMRFNVLKCLVEFMYCGKTQCLEENLDELVSAAQFLKIKGLSKVTKEGLGIANNSELHLIILLFSYSSTP